MPLGARAGGAWRVLGHGPAAAAVESFTLPQSHAERDLHRVEGRIAHARRRVVAELARHHCTLCIFLSITLAAPRSN